MNPTYSLAALALALAMFLPATPTSADHLATHDVEFIAGCVPHWVSNPTPDNIIVTGSMGTINWHMTGYSSGLTHFQYNEVECSFALEIVDVRALSHQYDFRTELNKPIGCSTTTVCTDLASMDYLICMPTKGLAIDYELLMNGVVRDAGTITVETLRPGNCDKDGFWPGIHEDLNEVIPNPVRTLQNL